MEKNNIPQPSFFECRNEEEVISISTKLGFPIVLIATYCRSRRIEKSIERLEKTLDEHVDKDKKK